MSTAHIAHEKQVFFRKTGEVWQKEYKTLWRLYICSFASSFAVGDASTRMQRCIPAGGLHPATHGDASQRLQTALCDGDWGFKVGSRASGMVSGQHVPTAGQHVVPAPRSSQCLPGGSALARTLLTTSILRRSWTSTQGFSRHNPSSQGVSPAGMRPSPHLLLHPFVLLLWWSSAGLPAPPHVPLPGFVSSNKSGEAQAFQSPLTSLLMTYIISSSTCFSFFLSFVI